MRIPVRDIFAEYYGKSAVAAFNVFNAEQVHGVMRGAHMAGRPVLLAVTPVAREYMNPHMMQGIITAAERIYPDVQFAVHLDHGNMAHCLDGINSGYYDSVMIDASHEDFEENVRITGIVAEAAHRHNVFVEAELGVLSGVEDDIHVDDTHAFYTNPELAGEFVRRTACNSLAVAVGTSHGAYKFPGQGRLRLDILEKIRHILPGFPLVLHGASSVPLSEIDRINKAGGAIQAGATGTDAGELRQAISLGVVKINIATDMRLLWTRIHREFFRDQASQFDMVIPGKKYVEALTELVYQKINEYC